MSNHIYVPVEKFVKRAQSRIANVEAVSGAAESVHKVAAPTSVSLRNKVVEIYDQGQLGSCTANAFCAAYNILEKDKTFHPSRLWVYFYERLMEDPQHNIKNLTDSGADVVDGENYVKVHGVCGEALWPYDISKYNCAPPQNCIADAANHKIASNKQITFDNIRFAVAAGYPVLIAIAVYESFENSGSMIPMPKPGEQLLGGHELCLVGYDDKTQLFEVQNSWGVDWGDNGFCYIPYKYLASNELCQELTVIKLNV